MKFHSVAVYCGSKTGNNPVYGDAARSMGRLLAKRGYTLIYGGGNVGLMGILADAVLSAGGQAIGVMPHLLIEKEIAHSGLTELHSVDSMHERKQKMMDLADAFVALPGGLGTLEELFEAFTWFQLGIHQKPCALFNVSGFYDPLIEFLNGLAQSGFMKKEHAQTLLIESDPETLVDRLEAFKPSHIDK